MELKEIFNKVDKAKLKKALAADDPDQLNALLAETGVELTNEQLDYIAGGAYGDDGFTSYC